MGMALIFVLYLIVTVLSIYGGYLPKLFVEKKGMGPYAGRMRAMLIFAFFPLFALFAQPLGANSAWFPAIIIGLAGAGHQAWSANLFSTIGDMFPKSTIATITGIGAMLVVSVHCLSTSVQVSCSLMLRAWVQPSRSSVWKANRVHI